MLMKYDLNVSEDEIAFHRKLLNEIVAADISKPPHFSGRGIVICGGGIRYFTCAWVCINMLRKLGCTLPVEVWHFGKSEMSHEMQKLLVPLNAKAVDALEVKQEHPVRILNGWELKPYAIIHSSFEEVLFLDADNIPVVNPEFLFETAQYKETGAIFWPDLQWRRLSDEALIWRVCEVDFRDEPEFETGQIVVDKKRCWKALCVTMHLNEYSDFYYRLVYGDKDTFHMAWRKLKQDFSMTGHSIEHIQDTMCQHDFEGRRIFQHRNMDKWTLEHPNKRIEGFEFEDECFEFLDELKKVWSQRITYFDLTSKSEREKELITSLLKGSFVYRRVGYDQRTMCFFSDGVIGKGSGGCERFWDLREDDGVFYLSIFSGNGDLTCKLQRCDDGIWKGQWEKYEKMPIEIIPQEKVDMREKIEALPYTKSFAKTHGVDLAIPNWPNSGIGNILIYTRLIEDLSFHYGRPLSIITAPLSPEVGVVDGESPYPFFENNPFIERIINANDVDPEGFSRVNAEEWNLVQCSHLMENLCFAYGIKPRALRPAVYLTCEEKQWALESLKSLPRPLICLHPGGTTSSREGSPWHKDNWLRLVSALRDEAGFFQIGKKGSVDQDLGLFHPGKTIREAMALIWASDIFIGFDSSPMHMATALQKPVITLIDMKNKFDKESKIRDTFASSVVLRWTYPDNTNFAIMPEDNDGDVLLARVVDAVRQKVKTFTYQI